SLTSIGPKFSNSYDLASCQRTLLHHDPKLAESMSESQQSSQPESSQSESLQSADHQGGFRVLVFALLSQVMLWLSFPPVGVSWMVWLAPVPLVWLILNSDLPAKRPYWQLFYAGLLYWLGTFYFIPIPHPALWAGWFVVSAYMALYTPIFVAISRTMIHRLRVPEIVAIPLTFTGIEWFRCNFLTGMGMYCLSHTQYQYPVVIQVADLFGAYTLTFVIMLAATGLTLLVAKFSIRESKTKSSSWPFTFASVAVAAGFLIATLLYGQYRLDEKIQYRNEASLTFGLIQTSEDVIFGRPTKLQTEIQIENKFKLTWAARKQWDDLDLIVWPESGLNPEFDLISDFDREFTAEYCAGRVTQFWSDATGFPQLYDSPISVLTGGGTEDPSMKDRFNAALLIGLNGKINRRYFKNHLVMFGEYVPFARDVPFINSISPIPSLTPGTKFETIEMNEVRMAPNICFETTVPHFIRRQINTLTADGVEPDVMVNLTNDGWFYGTSCLDAHLACNVFRAVEMRKPLLVCANTGFSAEIDTCGNLLQVGPRRKSTVIRAKIKPVVRTSLYRQVGDVVPMVFAGICFWVGAIGFFKRSKQNSPN
ncbi:MAG: apolipoprotein N-acyltransferase, partial [Mariniblastus sp.]